MYFWWPFFLILFIFFFAFTGIFHCKRRRGAKIPPFLTRKQKSAKSDSWSSPLSPSLSVLGTCLLEGSSKITNSSLHSQNNKLAGSETRVLFSCKRYKENVYLRRKMFLFMFLMVPTRKSLASYYTLHRRVRVQNTRKTFFDRKMVVIWNVKLSSLRGWYISNIKQNKDIVESYNNMSGFSEIMEFVCRYSFMCKSLYFLNAKLIYFLCNSERSLIFIYPIYLI